MSLLETINGPEDLEGLSDQELQQLAQEVREHIIDTVGEIGGHFGANLGTCELAVALHSLLDSPRDKILWDVGHQAYPHKVLTGRRDRLSTIRQYGGLAPFCSIAESPHDIMGAGHASTSIGYAVGIKEAMRQEGGGEDGKVVAVIGDGAMTGGVAFEAIGQAGGLGTPIVVVLNDNGMSIAPNVGALSLYFNRIRLNPKLWHARADIEGGLTRLPIGIGAAFERLGPHLKESIKAFWAPGLWWEELDWAYMGVIDGHDLKSLRKALREALAAERPVVVHIATVKGKGFAPAEEGGLEGMEKWHAAKPKSILNGSPTRPAANGSAQAKAPPPQYTQVFGDALVEECRRDDRVVGITAAMNSGTGLSILQKAMPERYFDVGIAEQQAVLFASGLALQGIKPVVAIYSTFLQRAYDQIVHDVCLQGLDVVFAMDRAGLVGDDGPTHHGAFDIAYLRCLPNIVLMAPRDEAMLKRMLRTALTHDGPVGLRYPRGEGVGVALPAEPEPIGIGTGEILSEADLEGVPGRRVALIGYGSGVGKALEAAAELRAQGIAVTVADARFAKPIDAGLVAQLAAEHDLLVTVEEGVLAGGFGSAVWETLNETGTPIPRILRVGLPDRYVTHGKPALLHEEIGFTGSKIAERVRLAVTGEPLPGSRGGTILGARTTAGPA
jgi:1-deoxy-D-xylulose-5-phosphate synthase